ncbi:hypothetical protein CYY_003950 [Polysphondylium violaceum]|uniref:Transmembrane protein n=1 Tax=Polysphondylium violaceum TaxID=133409 RepID=A0A8J4V5M5_9MYCE|nr:hypothetical protein CYY_003950 [Polysphondylium violaceum]
MSYVGLGPRDMSESPFPSTYSNWKELIYFRSWQAAGFIPIVYYFSFIAGIIMFIAEIVTLTQAYHAGGFFLGLLYGALELVAIVLTSRIACEIALSIYDIRDNICRMSQNSGPAIISHQAPQQPHHQQQQQQQYQSNNEYPKYQEPYQTNL